MPSEEAASRLDLGLQPGLGQHLYRPQCRVRDSIVATATVCALLLGQDAQAQGAASSHKWQPVATNTTFETGDTWVTNGQRFRLYGVQSCLRGTAYTGPDGHKHDCGDASMHMLVGLVRAWTPACTSVGVSAEVHTMFVVCYADAATSAGPQRIELGTALIASGFAFAALDASGGPVNLSYMVAERAARASKTGLWSATDLPNPNTLLLNAIRTAQPARGVGPWRQAGSGSAIAPKPGFRR